MNDIVTKTERERRDRHRDIERGDLERARERDRARRMNDIVTKTGRMTEKRQKERQKELRGERKEQSEKHERYCDKDRERH